MRRPSTVDFVSDGVSTYLVVLSDRKPLYWVLSEQRMAFPGKRDRVSPRLRPGDKLLIYTTRACFHTPQRDRGRVIGEATVRSPVEVLKHPVAFDDRQFPVGCSLTIDRLAPARHGVDLQTLATEIHAFAIPGSWRSYLRRPLVPLDQHDADLLRRSLDALAKTPSADILASYARLVDRSPRLPN